MHRRYGIGGTESEDTVHRDSRLAENTEFCQCINVAQISMEKIYGMSSINSVEYDIYGVHKVIE